MARLLARLQTQTCMAMHKAGVRDRIAGSYALQVTQAMKGSLYPRCTPVKIFVVAKRTQNVTINCDTGIR